MTGKVTAGAKSFGSFLFTAVNKAGDKIKETALHNVSNALKHYITFNLVGVVVSTAGVSKQANGYCCGIRTITICCVLENLSPKLFASLLA